MKTKFAYIITIVVSLVTISCKSTDVSSDVPVVMQFGYQTTGNEAMDSFENNDQIAMYVIDADNDQLFTDFNYANYIYKLTNTYWMPIDPAKTVKWMPEAKPMFVYAYSPIAKTNSPITTDGDDDTTLNIEIPLDQTNTNLKTIDLLRAQNKGAGEEGLTIEENGENVKLPFKHMFCKVNINVFLKTTNAIDGNLTLNQIQLKGTQIANEAEFKLHNATLNVTAPSNEQIIHTTKNVVLQQTDQFINANSYNAQFVVLPFEPNSETTQFVFKMQYVDKNGSAIDKKLVFKIPEYTGRDDQITFNENMLTEIQAIIVINYNDEDDKIVINSTIHDWNENDIGNEIMPT